MKLYSWLFIVATCYCSNGSFFIEKICIMGRITPAAVGFTICILGSAVDNNGVQLFNMLALLYDTTTDRNSIWFVYSFRRKGKCRLCTLFNKKKLHVHGKQESLLFAVAAVF